MGDTFLDRGRPLGQARVLWEIGPDGRDVRDLRARLGLDSGYLSSGGSGGTSYRPARWGIQRAR